MLTCLRGELLRPDLRVTADFDEELPGARAGDAGAKAAEGDLGTGAAPGQCTPGGRPHPTPARSPTAPLTHLPGPSSSCADGQPRRKPGRPPKAATVSPDEVLGPLVRFLATHPEMMINVAVENFIKE